MVLNQNNDFQVQVAIPLRLENMPKQIYNLALEAIAEICDTAEFCNKNHSKSGYKHLPYYGELQYYSASLMIIVETDGSKTIFLDIDAYFEHDDLHKSFRLENLSEELIDRYSGIALMTTVQNLAENLSRCKFNYTV